MTNPASPILIGKREIKNRITMAPTVKFYAGDDGLVTDEFVRHYEERAAHGAGLIVLEATCVAKEARLHPTQLGLWNDSQTEGHKRIAEAVHKHGALIMPQLHHGGLGTHPSCGQMTSPTRVLWNNGYAEAEAIELTHDDIQRVKDRFVKAALRAQKAGYDGVQLHGCHGYLINDFASNVNKRTDEYGGSTENKARLGSEIISTIRSVCGGEFIISMRISGADPTVSESIAVAESYVKAGCDYLQVSCGIGSFDDVPDADDEHYNKIAALGVNMHAHFNGRIPVSCVNGLRTVEKVQYLFDNDLIDTVDLGCGLLADPAFTEAILYGKPYVPCFNCKSCAFKASHTRRCPAMIKRGCDESIRL